ncbi:MAG: hypothetical protein OEM15_13415 [Myxococcales bacterium]|nr:hypothetical protein [Myxococcales bacterium]MDH3484218.1 hypothetical protein [Myxococcales bacterium]
MKPTKFQVKLYTSAGEIELEKLVPVFHRWIREKRIPDELLIDVADYAHVPQGPGVVLIGHQSDYYLDVADDRPGLLYSRKRGFEGDFQAGIEDAFRRALRACQLLESEADLGLDFATDEMLFRVQDRLAAPNDDVTYDVYRGPLEKATGAFFGSSGSLERIGSARDPFAVRIVTGANGSVGDALARY